MSATAMLEQLARWRASGWLRDLDVALARFVHELDAEAPASLLLATALVAHLEGLGHSGLPLDDLADDAPGLLGWPAQAWPELQQALAQMPRGAEACRRAWQASPCVQTDPDDTAATPLVLYGGLLALRRYGRHESEVAARLLDRTADAAPAALDIAQARAALDRLFPTAADANAIDWQKAACALALRGRLTVITGGPGTGKTYTAARLLVLLQQLHAGPQPLRVATAAPTGKAAARLRQAIQLALQGLQDTLGEVLSADRWAAPLEPARTLHALLGTRPGTRHFRHDAAHPLDVDVLFVDEASMVHLEMMASLLQALPPQARLVLLGDKDQLASVEAGAVMGDLCAGADAQAWRPATVEWVERLTGQTVPPAMQGEGPPLAQQTVVLRRSHRFEGPIGQLADAVNRGDGAAALALLRTAAPGPLALLEARDPATAMRPLCQGADGFGAYLQRLAQRPADAADFEGWAREVLRAFDGFRVLCAVREGAWGVAGLNAAIERTLAEAGLLVQRGEWYEGRPVMVTRNSATLGVFNGDVGIVLRAPGGGPLRACFLDGDGLHTVAVGRLADVEAAFAMTVHKSQGSEFGHVVLVLPEEDLPLLTRELVYTGITRARSAFTLLTRHAGLLGTAAQRMTRRVSGLRARLGSG